MRLENFSQIQNEFVALADRRLQYISGFSGSAGKAIITADKAALQTDVRYFEQADQQLDCQWTLITEQGWMAVSFSTPHFLPGKNLR